MGQKLYPGEASNTARILLQQIETLEKRADYDSFNKIICQLREVGEISTMQMASFSKIMPGPEDKLPTSEKEVDAFIKKRIRLWMTSWIHGPIVALLKEIDPKFKAEDYKFWEEEK